MTEHIPSGSCGYFKIYYVPDSVAAYGQDQVPCDRPDVNHWYGYNWVGAISYWRCNHHAADLNWIEAYGVCLYQLSSDLSNHQNEMAVIDVLHT